MIGGSEGAQTGCEFIGVEARCNFTASKAGRPRTEDGAAPPPTTDSPSIISMLYFDEWIFAASASARLPISPFVRRIIRNVGIASWSRFTYASSVASRAA